MRPRLLKKLQFAAALILATTFVPAAFAQNKGKLSEATERIVEYHKKSLGGITIHFPVGKSLLMKNYSGNAESLARLDSLLNDQQIIAGIDSMIINAYSSPEGSLTVNLRLARERSQALKNYITQKFPKVDRNKLRVRSQLTDWKEIKKVIEDDPEMPFLDQTKEVLEQTQLSDRQMLERLKLVGNGKAFNYIARNYSAFMRKATGVIMYTEACVSEPVRPLPEPEPITIVTQSKPDTLRIVDTVYADKVKVDTLRVEVNEGYRKPLFALKTNLLFDAASLLNVELEVPLGKRWSIAGEYIFPWWLWNSKQYCLQSLSGTLEARYWFGKREERQVLTGWFAGLYGGGGYYDVENGKKGYQGEFYIATGISGGLAHTINRKGNLRMEYSLGLGYMKTKYREYYPIYGPEYGLDDRWYLIRRRSGHYTWIGPTRAKVSLVWLINSGLRTKGGAK
ncbi:MAG: DUF3575 domain-containing protein [Prevotellaceae bacterium]|nr:DUF3575 domain-containing protein [Prevotellaceae bacterium]